MQHDNVYSMHNHYAAGPFKQNRNKRRPPQRPSINVLPGQVAFRIVCHMSAIGGVIGNNGAIVSQLRRETGSKIHCEEAVSGLDHRVILIVGSGSIDKRIVLDNNYDECGEKVEYDVSSAQEAMIRVFERLWAVEAEKEGGGGGGGGEEEAYCGLLADTTQIGAVVGRGGKNIVRMRRETGAKIRILPPPSCAAKDDELIQIIGETSAVKKALVGVSGCLQDCPPVDRDPTLPSRAIEKAKYGASTDPHAEFFPHLSSLLPRMTGNSLNTASNALLSKDAEGDPSMETKATEQEVVFRMLCSNGAAGGIIGKKGAIVRALQNKTGASIMFAPPRTESGERVVTISAFENLESWYSPAQNAVVLVFARSVESDIEKGLPSGLCKGTTVIVRLLVASELVDFLTGNRGSVLLEMIEVTGADVRILGEDKCASENEVIIQITGDYKNVQNALFQVTARLRENLLPSEVLNEVRARNPYARVRETMNPGLRQSLSVLSDSNQETVLTQKKEHGLSENTGALSPKLQPSETAGRGPTLSVSDGEQGSKVFGASSELERSLDYLLPTEVLNEVGARESSPGLQRSLGLFLDSDQDNSLTQGIDLLGLSNNIGFTSSPRLQPSGKTSTTVRNTMVEIVVAENVLGAVYGKDGINLARLRQISGAKVEVHDPCPGKSERMVAISGTPDQTRVAQSLLHAFILAV